ncbi:RNA-guided endonuclease InsQ/TnpB family protein [Desulfonema ishimotonii]|uniref:RNA-guided endonuclease InsQ/TnpB family protein n=1 Tax=Desulfonema ishimotonii TaxID=45657 RepID=UPI00140A642A|nr:RNA-guided endonuclease TnpB family protein [Desulfonema ishimotonii]
MRRVSEISAEAARCWNDITETANSFYLSHKKWMSKGDIQKAVKGGYALHSQTVQALTDRFCGNRETAARLRRNGDRKARYPYRTKRFVTIPFKKAAIRYDRDGELILTLAKGNRLRTGFVPEEGTVIRTAELVWNGAGNYNLHYTFGVPEPELLKNGLSAGIDIGEIHPVALVCEDGDGLIVSGRLIRSVKQWRNKVLAKLSKQISRCEKGSRKFKKYVRAKARLRQKTDRQIRDMLHKATRMAADFCSAKGIAEIVVGDLRGVEKNTRKKKRLGRKSRQKVSQMEYGKITSYLNYKAKERGISFVRKNERNTTKECPGCGCHNICAGRNYRCEKCGWEGHRDGKGAFMILRKKYPDTPLPEIGIFFRQVFPFFKKSIAGC